MLTLELLSARQGDAILVSWGSPVRRMLIDGGPTGFDDTLRARLMALPEEERAFELLVITHVDDDHIGALLDLLGSDDPVPGLRFKDVWFNGWLHLGGGRVPENPNVEHLGPKQGDRLSQLLFDRGLPWNEAFDRRAVAITDDDLPQIMLEGGLTLRVLGPDVGKMTAMRDEWEDVIGAPGFEPVVPAAVESLGPPPVLETWEDLVALASGPVRLDRGAPNGSSIVLLAEHDGASALLAGDAHAPALVAALERLSPGAPVRVDAFKLPHHGSKNNVTAELAAKLACPRWIFSSDGTRFKHPDAEAVARVVVHGGQLPELIFNARSKMNNPWGEQVEVEVGGFRTRYPEAGEGGVVVTLPGTGSGGAVS